MLRTQGFIQKSVNGAFFGVLMIVAGCGGSGAADEPAIPDEPLIQEVANQIANNEAFFGDTDPDCAARQAVTNLGGAQRISDELDLTAESAVAGDYLVDKLFYRDDATAFALALAECGFAGEFLALVALNNGSSLSEEDIACLELEVDKKQFADALAATFMDPSESSEILDDLHQDLFSISLFAAVGRCDTPVELTDWFTIEQSIRE